MRANKLLSIQCFLNQKELKFTIERIDCGKYFKYIIVVEDFTIHTLCKFYDEFGLIGTMSGSLFYIDTGVKEKWRV